jgi:hypothetical protein
LNELRESEEFEACEAALLMDNYSFHKSDDIVAVLTRVRAGIIIFAIHATHIFQMLDVVLFSALKKHATDLETLDEEQSAAAFLLKVCHNFKQTMIEVNIWKAFATIGFTHDIGQMSYGLLFDEENSDKVAASWSSGSAIRPSRVCRNDGESERRESKLGWINKPD